MSPFKECNASIISRLVQWNKSPYHKWDICGLHLRESHYDMPQDVDVERELHQQHILEHLYQFRRDVGYLVMRVLVLSISDVLVPKMLSVVTPTQIYLLHHP